MKLYRYFEYFLFETVLNTGTLVYIKMKVQSNKIQIQMPNYKTNSVEKSSSAMVKRMQAAFPRSIATLRRCIRNILALVS